MHHVFFLLWKALEPAFHALQMRLCACYLFRAVLCRASRGPRRMLLVKDAPSPPSWSPAGQCEASTRRLHNWLRILRITIGWPLLRAEPLQSGNWDWKRKEEGVLYHQVRNSSLWLRDFYGFLNHYSWAFHPNRRTGLCPAKEVLSPGKLRVGHVRRRAFTPNRCGGDRPGEPIGLLRSVLRAVSMSFGLYLASRCQHHGRTRRGNMPHGFVESAFWSVSW